MQGRSYGKRQRGNDQLFFLGINGFCKGKGAGSSTASQVICCVSKNMLLVSPSITLSNANAGMACKRACRTASIRRGSGSPSAGNKHMLYDEHDQYDGVIWYYWVSSDHD